MAIQVGAVISGFKIDAELGEGGMSRVYRATQLDLQRRVALKVMAPHLAEDPQYRARFLREARTAAGVDHPNVLPVYQAGEVEDMLWLAMRYVDGGDLRQLLERGIPDRDRCLALLRQVAAGLDAAHRAGLVHRDVKPENVLLTSGTGSEPAGHVYLADFGLTKSVATSNQTGGSNITGAHEFLGTVAYAAPEQIEAGRLDHRVDIYALGCMLYECFTGEPPFSADTSIAALYAHLEREPPKVTDARPDLPLAIDDVIKRAMAKQPTDRFDTATELMTAATRALAPLASPAAALAPTLEVSIPRRSADGAVEDASRPRPRRLALVVPLVGALGVVAVTGGALLAWRTTHSNSSKPKLAASASTTTTSSIVATGDLQFAPAVMAAVPAGWHVQENNADLLSLEPDGLPHSLLSFVRAGSVVDPAAEPHSATEAADSAGPLTVDALEWLKQHPRLSVKATGPIIGMDVVTQGVDADVASGYTCGTTRCVWLFRLSKTYFALLADNKNSLYEMKVGPDTVMIGMESSSDELARFRAVAFPLLRSLHLSRPG
jgi:serine/threonine-protein kinase